MREEIQSRIKNMLEQADRAEEPLGQAKKFYRWILTITLPIDRTIVKMSSKLIENNPTNDFHWKMNKS